jgi:hypothetical protein
MEQQLQAGSNTLVGTKGEGIIVSVGSVKVALQCGDCAYHNQQIRHKKALCTTGRSSTLVLWTYQTSRLGVDTPQAYRS